jgi:hypothetical protein
MALREDRGSARYVRRRAAQGTRLLMANAPRSPTKEGENLVGWQFLLLAPAVNQTPIAVRLARVELAFPAADSFASALQAFRAHVAPNLVTFMTAIHIKAAIV